MSNFAAFFLLELKRFFGKRNLIILLILFILLGYYLQTAIDADNTRAQKVEQFKTVYWNYFKNVRTYSIYSVYGIEVLFVKANLDILFRNAGSPENLTAKFDNTSTLRLLSSVKGAVLTPGTPFSKVDFAGILLMLVTLLAAGYGYLFLNSRPFYRFLSTLVPPWKAYLWMILSRLCIIALWVLLLFALVVFLAAVNGVVLSTADYAGLTIYMAAALIMLFFFFFIGVISGTVRQKDIGLTILFGSWLVFLYVIPGIITDIADRYNPGISAGYQVELDKFKIVSYFEIRAKKKTGGFNSNEIEVGRKVTKSFLEKEFKKVKAVEKEFIDRVSVYRDHYSALALLTPVSFFQLTGNEVSSRGFDSFLDFYRYCSELQAKFARFYIDRCYNYDIRELVSFIKDDENIYYSKTRIPRNFGRGIIIGLCWVVLLAVAGFYRFLAYLFRVDAPEKLKPGSRAVILSKSELKVYGFKKAPGFNEKLFNLFSGRFHRVKTGEVIKIEIANRDLSDNRKPVDFAYICRPSHIPVDISSRAFIRFVASLSGVSRAEWKTLLAAAPLGAYSPGKVFSLLLPYIKREIYLVDNTALDMPGEFLTGLNDIMKDWAASGASVLYLTTERAGSEEKYKKEKSGCDFTEEKMWSETVSRLKELNPDDDPPAGGPSL